MQLCVKSSESLSTVQNVKFSYSLINSVTCKILQRQQIKYWKWEIKCLNNGKIFLILAVYGSTVDYIFNTVQEFKKHL